MSNELNKKNLAFLALRREFWKNHPEVFAEELLDIKLTKNQRQICKDLIKHNKLTIKTCNSLGKTFLLAIIILWFFYVNISDEDSVICVFTAPVFAQIKTGLYANFRNNIKKANINLKKKFKVDIQLFPKEPSENKDRAEFWYDDTSYIIGISTDNSNAIAGKHAKYVLVIFDEAQGIKEDVYSGFKGIMKSGVVKEILLGNTTLPNGCSGRFYESFGEHSPYHKISITAFETPNFTLPDIKLEDYFCSENDSNYWRHKIDKFCGTNFKDAKLKDEIGKWENEVKLNLPLTELTNPVEVYNDLVTAGFNIEDYEIKTRILAQFPDSMGGSTYPLTWIHNSKSQWAIPEKFRPGKKYLGIDFGRGVGKDKSAFAYVDGNKCEWIREYDLTTTEILNEVDTISLEFPFDAIKIENNGEGIHFGRLLREKGYKVYEVDAGSSPGYGKTLDYELKEKTIKLKKLFKLKRDECWWKLREVLNPEPITGEYTFLLPPDPELERQMRASTYRKNEKQQICVSSKDELRSRLKRSTDKLDALLVAIADMDEDNTLDNIDFQNLYTFNLKANDDD